MGKNSTLLSTYQLESVEKQARSIFPLKQLSTFTLWSRDKNIQTE